MRHPTCVPSESCLHIYIDVSGDGKDWIATGFDVPYPLARCARTRTTTMVCRLLSSLTSTPQLFARRSIGWFRSLILSHGSDHQHRVSMPNVDQSSAVPGSWSVDIAKSRIRRTDWLGPMLFERNIHFSCPRKIHIGKTLWSRILPILKNSGGRSRLFLGNLPSRQPLTIHSRLQNSSLSSSRKLRRSGLTQLVWRYQSSHQQTAPSHHSLHARSSLFGTWLEVHHQRVVNWIPHRHSSSKSSWTPCFHSSHPCVTIIVRVYVRLQGWDLLLHRASVQQLIITTSAPESISPYNLQSCPSFSHLSRIRLSILLYASRYMPAQTPASCCIGPP